jgi:O-antigen ligase
MLKSLSAPQWIETAGIVGLFVFAFGILFRKDVAHAGITLMALSFAVNLRSLGKGVWRDRLLILALGFFIFLVLRTFFAVLEFPEHKTLIYFGALKLFGAGFFLSYLVAYWLFRARSKENLVLIAMLAGFLVQVLRHMNWDHFPEFERLIWTGTQRATFGFSANRFGLFSALIVLACMLLHRQIWGPNDGTIWHKARIALWGLMRVLSTWGLAFSQSRKAWFAFAFVTPLAAFCKLRQPKQIKRKTLLLGGSLFLIAAAVINLPEIIERRLAPGIDTVSISARLSLYRIAWENWKEHPLFGCGPGTSWILIQQAGEEYAAVKQLDHLHNVVFDIAAQVGVVGIGFYALFFYLIIRQALLTKDANGIDRDYLLFALGGIALILLTGISGQPLSSPHGVYLISFLSGICYSYKFASIRAAPSPTHSGPSTAIATRYPPKRMEKLF